MILRDEVGRRWRERAPERDEDGEGGSRGGRETERVSIADGRMKGCVGVEVSGGHVGETAG